MTIATIFLVNAGLSFALSLVVAHLLGPAEFGRYAVALSAAVVINTTFFEWLRLSATRFYSERTRTEAPAIRATLNRGYLLAGSILAALTAAALAFGVRLGLSPALLAATAACGLTLGLFDFSTALARARFHDRAYAVLALARGLLGFALAAAAARLWGDPAVVLAASSLAVVASLGLVRRSLADPTTARVPPRRDLAMSFARYAVPLVAASALYQLLPVLNRALLADRAGFAEAGYFSLASEIGTRLFQNLGSALDLILFQLAIRVDELHGRAQAQRQISRNIGIVAALLWPAAAGFWLILPSFEAVFVPSSFQGRFAPAMELLIPALGGFALIQYALNPVFQLQARTAPVVAAAILAIAVDMAAVLFWPGAASPRGFAAAQLAGLAAAALLLGCLALRDGARLPWRDLACGGLAAVAMAAVTFPLRALPAGIATLALQVGSGALVYGAAAVLLDVAGLRGAALARLGRRSVQVRG